MAKIRKIGTGNRKLPRSKKKNRKMRKKIPHAYGNIIKLLNSNIEEINLSVVVLNDLKEMEVKTLNELRKKINNHSPILKKLGMKAREEINKIFKKNKITVRANWIWDL